MPVLLLLLNLLFCAGLTLASPTASPPVSVFSATQISSFKPYSFYAAAAYCNPSTTLSWTCGANCQANPTFKPIASGGDGASTQFWFVGYDPTLQTVIVGHQGTDVTKIQAILTDANFDLEDLRSDLFPNAPSGVQVHAGFKAEHAKTASPVLAAVHTALSSQSDATTVTVIGHSLGAALSLLDAVYLRSQLPSNINVKQVGYASPRVGNSAFADYVDTLQGLSLTHIANKKDIGTVIPLILMGYRHTSGEVHIKEDNSWSSCPGHDNANSQCTTGDVPLIFLARFDQHSGPYDGVMIGGC